MLTKTIAGLFVAGLVLFESFLSAPCLADQPVQYPRVYGPTGRLYGPTQAHYQYQKQYGRPWHGYRGLTAASGPRQHNFTFHTGAPQWFGLANPYAWNPGVSVGGYPGYYGYYGGPVTYGWVPTQSPFPGGVDYQLREFPRYPTYSPAPSGYYGPGYVQPGYQFGYNQQSTVLTDPVLREAWEENIARWKEPITEEAIAPRAQANLKPATPDKQLEADRKQARGDAYLQEQRYFEALRRYREAIRANPHDAELHFREGFAFVALGQLEEAVESFKQGLRIDPDYPRRGVTLDEIYGDDHEIAQSSFQHQVAQWVREDIRDPDRLFLMGALLHFDQDRERSQPFFEAAYRLSGRGAHLMAFMQPDLAERATRQPTVRRQPADESAARDPSDAGGANGTQPKETQLPAPPPPADRGAAGEPGPGFPPPI